MKSERHCFVGILIPKVAMLRRVHTIGKRSQCQGMTLLELLIVVALLSIVALASTSLIIDTGEWKRQQETEDQWLNIKRAIVGDNVVDARYRREYSGFVADMGRLPNCMRELIRPYDCEPDLDRTDASATDATRLAVFSQDIDSKQWSGWRGPYLGIPGANEYRDGWRNEGSDNNIGNDDDVNYGWLFGTGASNGNECQDAAVEQKRPGTIILQSCGDDGRVDYTETGFAGDYPSVEFDGTDPVYIPLITRHDYQVDLGESWMNAPINIKSTRVAQSRIIPADSLRVRINYPVKNGEISDWGDITDEDEAPFLSVAFPEVDRRLVDATGKVYTGDDGAGDDDLFTDALAGPEDVTVPAGTEVSGTLMTIPNAVSSTLIFEGGSELELQDCPCELELNTVPTTLPVSGTLTGVTTIAIKPQNIAPIAANINKYVIELPQGTDQGALTATSAVLPNGVTLTFSRAANIEYFPKIIWDINGIEPTVTVAESFNLMGDLVTTDNNRDQFLVPSTSGTANPIVLAAAVPSIPIGLRNITVICEDDGELFDGNCADNATVKDPIATPYQLEVSPRSYVPVPNGIVWNTQ